MSAITLDEFNSIKEDAFLIDVRRDEDYEQSAETIPGAVWKNPAEAQSWVGSVPKDQKVVIYCVRGGGVSINVVGQLKDAGVDASYIEGGIEGVKSAGGEVSAK